MVRLVRITNSVPVNKQWTSTLRIKQSRTNNIQQSLAINSNNRRNKPYSRLNNTSIAVGFKQILFLLIISMSVNLTQLWSGTYKLDRKRTILLSCGFLRSKIKLTDSILRLSMRVVLNWMTRKKQMPNKYKLVLVTQLMFQHKVPYRITTTNSLKIALILTTI